MTAETSSTGRTGQATLPDLKFTHLGLYVHDVEIMARFYREVLGFAETDRGSLDGRTIIFLSRDPDEHHQIVFISGLAPSESNSAVNQISFRMNDLEGLLAFSRMLSEMDVDDLQPINHGNAWAVYFRDPEGHRVEVYVPSPWYINQPCRVPLDIDRSAEEIRRTSEQWCREQEGFLSADVYKAKLAEKIKNSQNNTLKLERK